MPQTAQKLQLLAEFPFALPVGTRTFRWHYDGVCDRVIIEPMLDPDVKTWCLDHIGPTVCMLNDDVDETVLFREHYSPNMPVGCLVRFKSEADRIAFRLRWL